MLTYASGSGVAKLRGGGLEARGRKHNPETPPEVKIRDSVQCKS